MPLNLSLSIGLSRVPTSEPVQTPAELWASAGDALWFDRLASPVRLKQTVTATRWPSASTFQAMADGIPDPDPNEWEFEYWRDAIHETAYVAQWNATRFFYVDPVTLRIYHDAATTAPYTRTLEFYEEIQGTAEDGFGVYACGMPKVTGVYKAFYNNLVGNTGHLLAVSSTDKTFFQWGDNSTVHTLNSQAAALETRHHWIVEHDGTEARVYQDGSASPVMSKTAGYEPLASGNMTMGNSLQIGSEIDCVVFKPSAFTAAERTALWRFGRAHHGAP